MMFICIQKPLKICCYLFGKLAGHTGMLEIGCYLRLSDLTLKRLSNGRILGINPKKKPSGTLKTASQRVFSCPVGLFSAYFGYLCPLFGVFCPLSGVFGDQWFPLRKLDGFSAAKVSFLV